MQTSSVDNAIYCLTQVISCSKDNTIRGLMEEIVNSSNVLNEIGEKILSDFKKSHLRQKAAIQM